MHLVFMGMGGSLSAAPLRHLLGADHTFSAVVIAAADRRTGWRALPRPGGAKRIAVLQPSPARRGSIVQMAWEHGIPLFEVGDLSAEATRDALRMLAPDAVLVSCFAYRIPRSLLGVPKHGFLNLHPSLLPAYRGPFPVFWQLRDGLGEIGLTIHRMDERLDRGPVALHKTVSLETGMSGSEIDRRIGEQGGKLFASALEKLAAGTLTFEPQVEGGSYQGYPRDEDFTLDRSWSARRVFSFMRGTAEWRRLYSLVEGGRTWRLREAVSYEPQGLQSRPVLADGNGVSIQFRPGILHAH